MMLPWSAVNQTSKLGEGDEARQEEERDEANDGPTDAP